MASLLPRLLRQVTIPSKRSQPRRWLVIAPRCPLALSRQCRQHSPVRRQSLLRQPISASKLPGRRTRPSDLLSGPTIPSLAILSPIRLHHRLHPVAARREPIMRRPSRQPWTSTGQVPRDRTRAVAATTTAGRREAGMDQGEPDPQTGRARAAATETAGRRQAREAGTPQKAGPQGNRSRAAASEAAHREAPDRETDAIRDRGTVPLTGE